LLAGPLGSFEAYAERISRIPVLTREQELELATRFRNDEDLEAARTLVMSHLRFVLHIARGYSGYGLPVGDLVQEGNVGLMKAVKRFQPDMGVRLVSFAVHWIRAEIHDYVLRNWRLVKIATTKAQRKLFFNLRSLKKGLGGLGVDDVKAIAQQLHVKPEEVVEMETRLGGQDVALEPLSADDEEAYAPIAYLAAEDAEPARALEEEQTSRLRNAGLTQALESLDPRSRRIVEARWLAEKDAATLHDLAAELGVSAERVRQIEVKALAKMKGVISRKAA
jgi:RNA polymerase sigma-32 factor